MDRNETEGKGKDNNKNNQSSIFDSKKLMALPKSDLLNRVGAFLPQIQKANQEIEQLPPEKSMRVDLELKSDNENDMNDSSDSSSDDGESSEQEGDFLIKESSAKKPKKSSGDIDDERGSKKQDNSKSKSEEQNPPTIEFKFALGAFDQNPAMSLLAGDTDGRQGGASEPSEMEYKEDVGDPNQDEKQSAISSLLNSKKKSDQSSEAPRGPLITELS